jgi:hypothetical protein
MKSKIKEIFSILNKNSVTQIGLLTGLSGQIIACSEYELHNKTENSNIYNLLDKLSKKLANEQFTYTYCDGLAGVGFMYEYLNQKGIIENDTNVLLEEFDAALKKMLGLYMYRGEYDFLHGGIGIALYFIKRANINPKLIPVLKTFILDLFKLSINEGENYLKWSSIIDYKTKKIGYNISLSHGMTSIVCVMLKMYNVNGLDKKIMDTIINSSINYILSQQINKDKYGCFFPTFSIESNEDTYLSRLGWCYGDLTIATTLFQVGQLYNNRILINKSIEILSFAAEKRKSIKQNMVMDAGLCHGTAGIGHIFYRMWWNTHLPEFKTAADYWFKETLKMAHFYDGLAGYKAWKTPEYGGWINEYGLLEGIAGIGLAMFSYYYEINPKWDECLLLS